MSTRPASTSWLIAAGEGDSPEGCPLRVAPGGAANQIKILAPGLDGRCHAFRVGHGAGDKAEGIEFGEFAVLDRRPGVILGEFIARSGGGTPATGRLVLVATVTDGDDGVVLEVAVECESFTKFEVTDADLHLNYDPASNPPNASADTLYYSETSGQYAPNSVMVTGSGLDSNMGFALEADDGNGYTFTAPPYWCFVFNGTELTGPIGCNYTPPVEEGEGPSDINITLTIINKMTGRTITRVATPFNFSTDPLS